MKTIYVDFKNKKIVEEKRYLNVKEEVIKVNVDVSMFLTQPNPGGYQDLIIVDRFKKIIDQLEEACFGNRDSGINYNGWGQVESGSFIGYDDDIYEVSNYENFKCECEECEKAQKEKDWKRLDELNHSKGMFDYINECGEFGEPLQEVDPEIVGDHINNINRDKVFEFLKKYVLEEDLKEIIKSVLENSA